MPVSHQRSLVDISCTVIGGSIVGDIRSCAVTAQLVRAVTQTHEVCASPEDVGSNPVTFVSENQYCGHLPGHFVQADGLGV